MANKKDSLGDRMKEFYENRTKTFLPRRTYTMLRVESVDNGEHTKQIKK